MTIPKLAGKTVVITGSSAGIGAAIAIEMSLQGAQVTIHGRDLAKLNEVARQCEKVSPGKKKVCIVCGDLGSTVVRTKLITQTVQTFGRLDILINNAGTQKSAAIEDSSLEILDLMLDIHVRVSYHLVKIAIPELIKNKGSVINVSSILSQRPISHNVCMEYCMAKAALDQYTMWMARELGEKGVRVNSINPGMIDTEMFLNLGLDSKEVKHMKDAVSSTHALGRVGKPEDIAKVAAFLVSSDAAFVTGLIMRVDGGLGTMPTGPRNMIE